MKFYIGYISSLDHWVCGIAKEKSSSSNNKNKAEHPTNPNSSTFLEKVDIEEWKKRLEQLKKLYIYTSLMLIHKRFIDDESLKHGSRPSSLEICLHAAIEVIHLTFSMEATRLESLSTSPLTIYSMMMSLQILQSLFTNKLHDDYMVAQAEIQFEIGYSVLQRLMICHNPQSMIYHTLCHLWKKYKEYRAGLFHHNNNQNSEELLHKPNARLSTSTNICHPLNAFISGSRFIPGVPVTVAHHQALTNNTTTTLSSNNYHNNNNSNNNDIPETYTSNFSTTNIIQNNSTLSKESLLSFQCPPNNSSINSHSSFNNNNTNSLNHHSQRQQQQLWKIKEYYPNKSIPTPTISPSSSSSSLHPL